MCLLGNHCTPLSDFKHQILIFKRQKAVILYKSMCKISTKRLKQKMYFIVSAIRASMHPD